MSKFSKQSILLFIFSFLFILVAQGQSEEKKDKIINDSEEAKEEFLKADWQMDKWFKESTGYVIFPNVGKGGLGVGGAAGNGVLYENGTAIGMAKLTQISIGFQAGGQAYREIIFFENADALKRFKENNVELSAQVSAVAATVGASADAEYTEGVIVFTLQKGGIMYEASVGGQKFKFNPF
ncbi:MAG: YSC84-related protein [Cyclobacteriaceae bacterium]